MVKHSISYEDLVGALDKVQFDDKGEGKIKIGDVECNIQTQGDVYTITIPIDHKLSIGKTQQRRLPTRSKATRDFSGIPKVIPPNTKRFPGFCTEEDSTNLVVSEGEKDDSDY